MEKEVAQRMALNLRAELKMSRPRDRYKRKLRELYEVYRKAYITAMIQQYGIERIRAKCPHVDLSENFLNQSGSELSNAQ